jgi:hypothetical protein
MDIFPAKKKALLVAPNEDIPLDKQCSICQSYLDKEMEVCKYAVKIEFSLI